MQEIFLGQSTSSELGLTMSNTYNVFPEHVKYSNVVAVILYVQEVVTL